MLFMQDPSSTYPSARLVGQGMAGKHPKNYHHSVMQSHSQDGRVGIVVTRQHKRSARGINASSIPSVIQSVGLICIFINVYVLGYSTC